MHNRGYRAAMLLEQFVDCPFIADVDVVVCVIFDVLNQIVARLFSRSFRPEELGAQVVIDPDNASAGVPASR